MHNGSMTVCCEYRHEIKVYILCIEPVMIITSYKRKLIQKDHGIEQSLNCKLKERMQMEMTHDKYLGQNILIFYGILF